MELFAAGTIFGEILIVMKSTLQYLLAAVLAAALLAGAEYALVMLVADFESCFLHNSILGNILAWPLRIFFFLILSALLRQVFTPGYTTLKDRMMERDELEARRQAEKGASITPGNYAFDI